MPPCSMLAGFRSSECCWTVLHIHCLLLVVALEWLSLVVRTSRVGREETTTTPLTQQQKQPQNDNERTTTTTGAFFGAFVLMAFELVFLICVLTSTARVFFVPPIEFLSKKLNLSPDIAGITLLALGNGAPDVMTVRACVRGWLRAVWPSVIGGWWWLSVGAG